jgi:chromosome partitioning protein
VPCRSRVANARDFGKAVAAIERRHDFVVIDTPPHDSYLMRLAHSVTDTLVTPLNDSFLDLDVLAKIDPVTFAVTGVSHYAELVREMRRHRRSVDGDLTDWVVVRNRISPSGSSTKPVLCDSLQELALEVGFRKRRCLEIPNRMFHADHKPRQDGCRHTSQHQGSVL